ncbi:unnamed protein product [Hapterophycus canaliculatus]
MLPFEAHRGKCCGYSSAKLASCGGMAVRRFETRDSPSVFFVGSRRCIVFCPIAVLSEALVRHFNILSCLARRRNWSFVAMQRLIDDTGKRAFCSDVRFANLVDSVLEQSVFGLLLLCKASPWAGSIVFCQATGSIIQTAAVWPTLRLLFIIVLKNTASWASGSRDGRGQHG